jgi:hypothetical protein
MPQRSSIIPSGIVVCRYHNGGGLDDMIALVVARVGGIGPVLPILEGGRCVCHFVFGLHRLWWQHRVFLLGLRGQKLHPTSHPTPLPHVSNWPTGITSVGSHGRTIPPSLCYSLAFPSAYCADVALLIVLSNRRTNSTSTGRKRSSMRTLLAMDWTDYFHRQCNKRHIKMDEELELLRGAAAVLDTVIRHRIGFLDTSGRPVS